MTPDVDVSICVAVYRRHRPPNLRTLAEGLDGALDGLRGELVVALNGIDARAAGVPAHAVVVDLGANQGVPRGWNAAADAARGRILCFANDDLVAGRGAIRRLADAVSAAPDAGVVGPVGTMWDIAAGRHVAYLPEEQLAPGTVRECDVVSGFFFATTREVFDAVGGFDEGYSPCSFEEVDFCTAVRRRLGRRVLAVSGVDVEHEFAISAKRPWRRLRWAGGHERLGDIAARNRERFRAKWGDQATAATPLR